MLKEIYTISFHYKFFKQPIINDDCKQNINLDIIIETKQERRY